MYRYKPLRFVNTFLFLLAGVGLIFLVVRAPAFLHNTLDGLKPLTTQAAMLISSPQQETKMNGLIVAIPRQAIDPVQIEQIDGQKCRPWFAPTGDRYLCYAGTMDHPELWLASEAKGMEKLLVEGELITFQWTYDNQHIVYAPWPDPPVDPLAPPQPSLKPVFLLNVESGERKEIGQTTAGGLTQVAPSGDIAFLNEDTIYVVNPVQGTLRKVPSALGIGRAAMPRAEDIPNQTPEKLPDVFLTPSAPLVPDPAEPDPVIQTATLSLSTTINGEAPGCFPPDCEVRFRISPDGKRLALQQIILRDIRLVIAVIEEQTGSVVTTQMTDKWYPFAWSPDSTQLAYAILPPETRVPEMWVVNMEGSEPHQLAVAKDRRGEYEFLTWLPSGQDIVYLFTPSGANTISAVEYQILRAEGGEPYTLFTNGSGLEVFDNGRRIHFDRETVDGQFNPSSWVAKLSN